MKDYAEDLRELLDADQVFEEFKDADLVFVDLDEEYLEEVERPEAGIPSARLRYWLNLRNVDLPAPASEVRQQISRSMGGLVFRQLYKWGFIEVREDLEGMQTIPASYDVGLAYDLDLHIQPPIQVVELKIDNWQKALKQARRRRSMWANTAWVAMDVNHIKPALRNISKFREHGIGLMSLGDEIKVYTRPQPTIPWVRDFYRKYLWEVNERSWIELKGKEADWDKSYSEAVKTSDGNPKQNTVGDFL